MNRQELIKKIETKIIELIQENRQLKEENQNLHLNITELQQTIDTMEEEKGMMELELEDILENIISYSKRVEKNN